MTWALLLSFEPMSEGFTERRKIPNRSEFKEIAFSELLRRGWVRLLPDLERANRFLKVVRERVGRDTKIDSYRIVQLSHFAGTAYFAYNSSRLGIDDLKNIKFGFWIEPCPECHGRGGFFSGEGYYGDQNGDAGQMKEVYRHCPSCVGLGFV
jgi:hypothetical protein